MDGWLCVLLRVEHGMIMLLGKGKKKVCGGEDDEQGVPEADCRGDTAALQRALQRSSVDALAERLLIPALRMLGRACNAIKVSAFL